jgi:spore photoproduct lyase
MNIRKAAEDIAGILKEKMPINLGINKLNELTRLIYEISVSENISTEEVLEKINVENIVSGGRGELFHRLKSALLRVRYPSMTKGDEPHIMPLDEKGAAECSVWDGGISPKRIFIERSILDEARTVFFLANFPKAEIVVTDDMPRKIDELSKNGNTKLYNSRRENVFLTRARSAFIKACPCAKKCVRCGYWVLNIGFGCPMDCSYCYLQTYSNAPGMMFPMNIEEYYPQIAEFDRQANTRIRMGTGEFTDSLALDKYTKYSSSLIPFFRGMKNLVLELKTKISDINGVLRETPHDNVVISWSMNTPRVAERYETGAADVGARIDSALEASKKGYKIAFHFDPVVYYSGWERDYKNTVAKLFSCDDIKNNTEWISLGTLRYTPGLKQISERRFKDSRIFYEGEFFKEVDGKLRYPKPLRIDMYNKLTKWIRDSGVFCRMYLCMETRDVREGIESK